MTTQRTLKKQIRDRMKRNSERYTTARAHVLADRTPSTASRWLFTGGQQSDIAAATNALNAVGIVGPDGSPLTEAQVFGLAGGVGFLYGVFRYDTGPTLTITARNTSMPDTFLDQLWATAGLDAHVSTTGGAKKAATDLQRIVHDGRRALCSVGAGAMGYLGLPAQSSAMYPLVVGVVGIDGDDYLIDDRWIEPHRIPVEQLAQARAVLRSAKHRMVVVGDETQIDWETAIPEAIAAGVERFDEAPAKPFRSNVGVAGLQKWQRLLTDPKDRMGWPKVFGSGADAAVGFSRLVQCIDHDYTAPSAGRPLQAEFLRWAATVTNQPRLTEAADLFETSASHWSHIVEIAGNVDPTVKAIVGELDRSAELLGNGSPDELEASYNRRTELTEAAEVPATAVTGACEAIAAEVAAIVTAETEALAILGRRSTDAASDTTRTGDDSDRVTMLNPNTGRSDSTIARSVYEPVKAAILSAVSEHEGLKFGDLAGEVESRTDPELWTKNKVGWYTTTIKLDIEARGLIERFGSPQKLRITDAGRAESAS